MPTYKFKPEDIEPLLEGLAIYGTGGGGSPEWGRAIMEQDFSVGRDLGIIDLSEVSDGGTVVSGGIMGSVKILEEMGTSKVMAHWEDRFELLEVTRVMEGVLGKKIDYVVPFEVGGLNTPVILSLGARMGIPVLDGDALGRSAPETQMTSFIGHGISLTPMPLIDFKGNVVVVHDAVDSTYPDQLGRYVVTQGGGLGANNHYPMTGLEAKRAVIPNTISASLDLGRTVLSARARGEDPVEVVAKKVNGALLLVGEISALHEEESMGFYFTTAVIEAQGELSKSKIELIIKNETMMLRIDGETKALFPDLLLMLEPGSGRGLMSIELGVGSPLALIGVPCHPRLREAAASPQGSLAFSPTRYGQSDETYRPIESLLEGMW
jgi:hypothetical protein